MNQCHALSSERPQERDMTEGRATARCLLLWRSILTCFDLNFAEERVLKMESWYLLRSTKPGVRVRDLCREYEIETLREYRHRSRRQINEAREKGRRI